MWLHASDTEGYLVMREFEYKIFLNTAHKAELVEEALNKLGKEGWKLVGLKQKTPGYILFVLVREVLGQPSD